jgi:hypothetical protein
MKNAVEMGSCAMICIPSFIKIGSAIQKLIRGDTQTHKHHGDQISLLSFFQEKESRFTHSLSLTQAAEPFYVRWVPCHNGMARPQVADGGEALQVWRVASNILNKQSRTADKRWSSILGVGRGANNTSP